MTLDALHHRLFVNGMGNSEFVDVIDLATNALVNRICCFKQNVFRPGGLTYLERTNTLFMSNGISAPIRLDDPERRSTPQQFTLPSDPGEVRADPKLGRLYVSHGGQAGGVSAFTLDGQRVFDLPLGEDVSGFVLEGSGPRMFAVGPGGLIAVINRLTGTLIAQWSGADDGQRNAVAIDDLGHRLFVGSDISHFVTFDTVSGRRTGQIKIGGGCGSLFFDDHERRIYAVGEGTAGGSGGRGSRTYAPDDTPAITVLGEGTDGQFQVTGRVPTGDYSSTGAWDSALRRLYVAIPGWSWQRNEIRIFEPSPPGPKF